jgi:hypothetical protein
LVGVALVAPIAFAVILKTGALAKDWRKLAASEALAATRVKNPVARPQVAVLIVLFDILVLAAAVGLSPPTAFATLAASYFVYAIAYTYLTARFGSCACFGRDDEVQNYRWKLLTAGTLTRVLAFLVATATYMIALNSTTSATSWRYVVVATTGAGFVAGSLVLYNRRLDRISAMRAVEENDFASAPITRRAALRVAGRAAFITATVGAASAVLSRAAFADTVSCQQCITSCVEYCDTHMDGAPSCTTMCSRCWHMCVGSSNPEVVCNGFFPWFQGCKIIQ